MSAAFEAKVVGKERREIFLNVFGTDRVPIKSPVAFSANLPNKPGTLVYLVDIESLTADQVNHLVAHLSQVFDDDPNEVRKELTVRGMPIVAEEVLISRRAA